MKIGFDKVSQPTKGVAAVVVADDGAFGPVLAGLDAASGGAIAKAAKLAKFTGKSGSTLDLIAPRGLFMDRLLLIGGGKPAQLTEVDRLKLGGAAQGKLAAGSETAVLILDHPGFTPAGAADVALGARLAAYAFDRYKTKKKDENGGNRLQRLAIQVEGHLAARKVWARHEAVADGVIIARDLVNLPPNDLGPPEFAKRCEELRELGVEVEVLHEDEMASLGMHALLGVGRGSVRGSRLVVMRWKGASTTPVAFVGKGVTFDTGGISIKPAANMEDMKGDMAGAACVTGLMHALAARKARVDAIGIVGLVENMPDGNAQRPATSSPPCPARPSRSSTRMRKAASCSRMRSGTARTASSRAS